MLEVFGFSNADLGDVFAVYGVTAMLAYFPGGPIADRFSARRLIAASLCLTAAGGFYLASIPSALGVSILFGYWGLTTILLFWAALIRATREWGGAFSQGKAFGILDGGRGLFAAAAASIAVVVFSQSLDINDALSDPDRQRTALVTVIYYYTCVTVIAGVAAWFSIPEHGIPARERARVPLATVVRNKIVWVQALIVVCAYCGYKGLDNYSLYAVEVLGRDAVAAARFTAACAYLRPVAAVIAGLLADRVSASRTVGGLFLILATAYVVLGMADPQAVSRAVIMVNILITFAGVYALRGVYFALLEETQIPKAATGKAVGIVSVLGFTPDVFFAPIAGRILDAGPGLPGHQHYFLFLAGIMAAGVATAWILIALTRKPSLTT